MNLYKHPDDTSIDRPTLPACHPERLQECEDALAGALTKLMDDAEGKGWTIAEICLAVTSLSDSVMLHEVDLEETNFILRDMLRRT
jgi:hypothetical protein